MTALMDIQPIDREALVDALIEAGLPWADRSRKVNEMAGIVLGGLLFLITGEDGTKLSDDDLRQFAANEGALAGMLFYDLEEAWQRFPGEKYRKAAWLICDSIAAAFCTFFKAERWD